MFKANTITKSLSFFWDEKKIIRNYENENKGSLTIFANHNKKTRDAYESVNITVTIWGDVNLLQEFETDLYLAWKSTSLNEYNKKRPVPLLIFNGNLDGFNRRVSMGNGQWLKDSKGNEIIVPSWQINVNLNGFSNILIDPITIDKYKTKEVRSAEVIGENYDK